ncbi:MAG: single-stranded-DNA-specific exonuclease RecJ [Flavobacteriales bacterium]|nr:single-stranded-DNA-specific exonuclease RecJ [Flavobacteriales bacterium]MCB9193445.1 single-stranded-DNA-specific exonuclease RecJ [Flavobacteriales bacterium]
MTKRWRMKELPDPEVVAALINDKCPDPLANLLAQRGITTPEEAARFYRPRLEDLHDPFLMAGMRDAVVRIERALGDGERIMVYGDYDVDGTTAVALVHSMLSHFTGDLTFYIPDRYAEGYGISYQGIDRAKKEGVGLIIALDCGIKAIDKVRYAKEQGIDMIICDHHRPGDELPPAVAVLDPKRPDCPYPFKELSGCGIGFKLVQGLAQRNGIPFSELEPLLDLVAVSTACDIVPVVGENRVLMHFGLKRLNGDPRPGIRVMLEVGNVKRRIGVTELVFIVGPRINAAGRIEHGRQAVEMLLAHDEAQAAQLGVRIDKNNATRQDLDKETTRQALEMVASDAGMQDAWSTVLFDPKWHKGVIGIVASRLIEAHYRPTIVLTESNGKAAGSARSVKGFDVYEAISSCSDLLEQFGGHTYAAGLTMSLENVEAFRARFEQVVRNTLEEHQRVPEEDVDVEVPLQRLDPGFLRAVEHMAPFGPGNMRPMFLTRGVVDAGQAKIVGGDHLKLSICDPVDRRRRFDAIAFRQADKLDLVRSGRPFSVIYTLEENDWNGRRTMQLNVKDMKAGISDLLVNEAAAAPVDHDAGTLQ